MRNADWAVFVIDCVKTVTHRDARTDSNRKTGTQQHSKNVLECTDL